MTKKVERVIQDSNTGNILFFIKGMPQNIEQLRYAIFSHATHGTNGESKGFLGKNGWQNQRDWHNPLDAWYQDKMLAIVIGREVAEQLGTGCELIIGTNKILEKHFSFQWPIDEYASLQRPDGLSSIPGFNTVCAQKDLEKPIQSEVSSFHLPATDSVQIDNQPEKASSTEDEISSVTEEVNPVLPGLLKKRSQGTKEMGSDIDTSPEKKHSTRSVQTRSLTPTSYNKIIVYLLVIVSVLLLMIFIVLIFEHFVNDEDEKTANLSITAQQDKKRVEESSLHDSLPVTNRNEESLPNSHRAETPLPETNIDGSSTVNNSQQEAAENVQEEEVVLEIHKKKKETTPILSETENRKSTELLTIDDKASSFDEEIGKSQQSIQQKNLSTKENPENSVSNEIQTPVSQDLKLPINQGLDRKGDRKASGEESREDPSQNECAPEMKLIGNC